MTSLPDLFPLMDLRTFIVVAAGLGALLLLRSWIKRILEVDDGSMDLATQNFISGKWSTNAEPLYRNGPAPPAAEAMVKALERMPYTDDEASCAAQMKEILAAAHIPYETLISTPETLLRVSSGHEGCNGALWTRFTVQYNLFAGSIVALGSDEQRAALVASQSSAVLGCFAFTERGAGVLSGASVETTATFVPETDELVFESPTKSSSKNWISQGLYAEEAVILAELVVKGKKLGPHLFWGRIGSEARGWGSPARKSRTIGLPAVARPSLVPGVAMESNPPKTALRGLDNASVTFSGLRLPRTALLSRFCSLSADGEYALTLPAAKKAGIGNNGGSGGSSGGGGGGGGEMKRMLDVLIFRLLTGRIVLSEATASHALARLRRNWAYASGRELWRGRKPRGKLMSDMPLVKAAFRDYGRTMYIVTKFLAETREMVAESIRNDYFSNDMIEATCMCKFVGTGFGGDVVNVIRKVMGARGLQEDSHLGSSSFLPLATCAAEGDNTIMELKVVQDMVRGRTPTMPLGLIARVAIDPRGRKAAAAYASALSRVAILGPRRALGAGQLLRDLAWARTHLRIIDVWLGYTRGDPEKRAWLGSYGRVFMRFPTPYQT